MSNRTDPGKKLTRKQMKQVNGGTPDTGSIIWRCLYTLGGKTGTIYYECSVTDPSAPNYYCTKTDRPC
jgi:hypothetical protein